MKEVLIASNNVHKIEEIKDILEPLGIHVVSMIEQGIILDVDENAMTFEGNAKLKVDALREFYNGMILADDSGISIDAMDGKPGVHSARFMGEHTDYKVKNYHIVSEVAKSDKKGAHYTCSIAFYDRHQTVVFTGELHGIIASEPAGENGFGYDPIFIPTGETRTLAQMEKEEKSEISHRKKALDLLIAYIKEQNI